jgi:hypothetical protein
MNRNQPAQELHLDAVRWRQADVRFRMPRTVGGGQLPVAQLVRAGYFDKRI